MQDLAIRHPQLLRLLAYWNEQRAGRAMPSQADIDPEAIKPLVANIFMVEVEEDTLRLRYRAVGAALSRRLGLEIEGKYLDRMPLLYRFFAAGAYEEVLATRAPCYKDVSGWSAVFRVAYERLLLPLSSDGRRIDMVMGAIFED